MSLWRSTWRVVGVVLVLSVGVPVDMFACGDKFLFAGRGTKYQGRPNARSASILIYVDPASAMASAIKKAKIDIAEVLKQANHRAIQAHTQQELSNLMSGGRYDVILTAQSDSADVRNLLPESDASEVVPVDRLLKKNSLLDAIDKAVLQRDQNLKKALRR